MWGKYNSVNLWFFFFLVIVRVYSWHLQKCEATPDVERWRAELSWRGSSDETLPQRCSWNRWAFWVCQHRTMSSAKPLTDHLCVEALSLLPSNSRIWVTDSTGTCSSLHPSKHLHRCSMLGQRTRWCPHLGPHMHVGQAGKDIAHSLDNKPDLLNLGSHSSAHVTLLPSRPSPPPTHPPPIISQAVSSTTSSWASWRLPFPSELNISQTRCWSVLVISVVGLNPRWDTFQVDLKCVTRVKFDVFFLVFFSEPNTSLETTLK